MTLLNLFETSSPNSNQLTLRFPSKLFDMKSRYNKHFCFIMVVLMGIDAT